MPFILQYSNAAPEIHSWNCNTVLSSLKTPMENSFPRSIPTPQHQVNECEVVELTGGVQIGGVPPFGNLFDLPIYADPSLFENEKMVFNAGDRGFSVAMKSADWQTLTQPKIVNLI